MARCPHKNGHIYSHKKKRERKKERQMFNVLRTSLGAELVVR